MDLLYEQYLLPKCLMPDDYMITFLHCGLGSGMLVVVFESPRSLQEKNELKSNFLGKTCIF